MSIYEELATLTHEDLVKLSSLIHKLLKWDAHMTWDEALQKAYERVAEESDWIKARMLTDTVSRAC